MSAVELTYEQLNWVLKSLDDVGSWEHHPGWAGIQSDKKLGMALIEDFKCDTMRIIVRGDDDRGSVPGVHTGGVDVEGDDREGAGPSPGSPGTSS